MSQNMLFALDATSQEVIVSESPKGSKQINFVERVPRSRHEMLYQAVSLLTAITTASPFNPALFKAMDKVCQLLYAQK